jgi:hypothetical protein
MNIRTLAARAAVASSVAAVALLLWPSRARPRTRTRQARASTRSPSRPARAWASSDRRSDRGGLPDCSNAAGETQGGFADSLRTRRRRQPAVRPILGRPMGVRNSWHWGRAMGGHGGQGSSCARST